jgi:hypothetical protein
MATRDLDRLAKYVKAHRLEQYSSRDAAAVAAGITKDTWQRVEEGRPAREASYAKVDRALGWSVGSCVAVAEGGAPVLVDQGGGVQSSVPMAALSEDAVRRAAFEAARAKLPSAPIGDIDAFAEELVEVLRRSGMVSDGG